MQDLDPENALGRGTKQRKNLKKQMWDKALEVFVVQDLAHATRAEAFSHRWLPQPPAHKVICLLVFVCCFLKAKEKAIFQNIVISACYSYKRGEATALGPHLGSGLV